MLILVFERPKLSWILKDDRRQFPFSKSKRFSITKDLLEIVTNSTVNDVLSLDDLNLDTAFKVAWTGFFCLGEITYTAAEWKKLSFEATHVTRSDISFTEFDQYAVLNLKASKTDVNRIGVQIILAATQDVTCPVAALRKLFTEHPQPSTALLFWYRSSFSRPAVIAALKSRLTAAGISNKHFSGHSYRKGAAQHAADNGMPDKNIQRLGRWTSNSF